MARYWVVAPYHADLPELWDKVWRYNREHGRISVGWRELNDISALSEVDLRATIDRTYADKSESARKLYFRMLWDFYHAVQPGDVIIARRGTKKLAAIGTVTRAAYYEKDGNAEALGPDRAYSNHLDVSWETAPIDKSFQAPVFGIQTIYEIKEEKYRELLAAQPTGAGASTVSGEAVEDETEFVLERYLEDFIVSNFDKIFRGHLALYSDPLADITGQQFPTDVGVIDILAQEPNTNSFVVIELKKGRESDKVVGQILRYMGWVADKLCHGGQDVKGLIICRAPDPRLSYAIKMARNVSIKYYRVDFKLQDQAEP